MGRVIRSPEKVFPTHVGVFLASIVESTLTKSLPHACGGVSTVFSLIAISPMSSPRMWGCFSSQRRRRSLWDVFPTHVGVFLRRSASARHGACLPHACGGVSATASFDSSTGVSSPRMWGCFHRAGHPDEHRVGLPHACGGVSYTFFYSDGWK